MPPNNDFDPYIDDPKNWIWGMFYFSKDDKRLFPPKRIRAFGWTINFANPWSVLSFIGVIVGFCLMNYLAHKLFK